MRVAHAEEARLSSRRFGRFVRYHVLFPPEICESSRWPPENGMDTATETNPDRSVSDALKELALNLRWSWNHAADELWSQLDAELWDLTQNPWVMLQTVSREKLRAVTSDA
jgi:uncharacterized protein DUF3417